MRTAFTPDQLANPETAASAAAIRKCVHCGFCTATCPTYVLLGDERDSPRGRIELIKAMLEDGGPPAPSTVTVPPAGVRNPVRQLSRDVLPEPLAPRMVHISPSFTVQSTPRKIRVSRRVTVSWETERTGIRFSYE